MLTEKLNEVQKGKIAIFIIIILFILIVVYARYSSSSLNKHSIVTRGVVTEATFASKVGGSVQYKFFVNGKPYCGFQALPRLKYIEEKYVLVGRIFPVMVDTTDLSNSKILFDSLSFVRYGIQYPDSLNWLKKYLK